MSAWGVENLPHVLQNAIYSNDIPTIKRHLPKIQHDLDEALLLAMPHSAPFTIKFFLEAGARLGNNVFYAAFERQDTAVFEAFMETGWHIDDTPVQYSAVHLSIVSRRNESLLRWFLDRGADPDIRLRRHRNSCSTILSPMAEAARLGLTSELLMLFEFNATLDPEAMFYAIGVMRDRAHPGTATMQILLDHGADINFHGQDEVVTGKRGGFIGEVSEWWAECVRVCEGGGEGSWYIPGNGIAHEAISADIQRKFGPDDLVRPGTGTGENEGRPGYWVTVYGTLTAQMIQDLKMDWQNWQ
ncbi:hypothetical protein CC86DRAFT_459173 [Ophiobolus disseminans]|uniref:Uncharacterized protein n=1 Tax=Ophiobolus disseminans TaxID=1469910 RepID=A0A6A6ZKV3_9PLEO|nr:hypothetical protein CC86DRAFT_459173 [Ophiobolus disseminans]